MDPVQLNGSPKNNQTATAPEPVPREPSAKFTTTDLEMFAKLGIAPSLLAEARVERVTDSEARTNYGITGSPSKNMAGVLFPYFSPVTGDRTTCRLRRDRPEEDAEGKPQAKYIAPFGDPRHLYMLPGAAVKLTDLSIPVALVEAEKSALALTAWAQRTGMNVIPIGMGGCWSWRGVVGKTDGIHGEREDVKGPLPDLGVCNGRTVYILLDANAATNEKVKTARNALAKELRKRGCVVLICELPSVGGCNGPDDFIGQPDGDAAMAAVFDAAHAREGGNQASIRTEAEAQAVRRGYLRMPHSVLQHGPALGPYGLAVALVLADHANGHGTCWPSVRRIMESSGIGAQATVQKALEKLSDLGVIEIQKSRQGFITKHLYRFIGWNGEQASAISSDASAPFHRMKSNKNQRTRTKNSMGRDFISGSLSTTRSQQVAESRNAAEVSNSPIDDSCPTDSPDETAKELFTIESGNRDSAFIEGEL